MDNRSIFGIIENAVLQILNKNVELQIQNIFLSNAYYFFCRETTHLRMIKVCPSNIGKLKRDYVYTDRSRDFCTIEYDFGIELTEIRIPLLRLQYW